MQNRIAAVSIIVGKLDAVENSTIFCTIITNTLLVGWGYPTDNGGFRLSVS